MIENISDKVDRLKRLATTVEDALRAAEVAHEIVKVEIPIAVELP